MRWSVTDQAVLAAKVGPPARPWPSVHRRWTQNSEVVTEVPAGW